NNLCSAIRKVDRNRIIFVPEYQSREANPGEKYYHEDNTIIDSGEQGIIWETGFVKVDDSNVAYVFQFFDPYEYTFYGKGDYTIEDLQSLVEKRAMWARTIGKAPLVARYGISRINPSQQRVSWLQTVHSIFSKFNISSSYHEYKNLVGTYNPSNDGFFAIYGQYNNWKNEISLTGNSYSFFDKDMEYTAETTKFKDVLDRFFFKDGKIESVSIMDNEDILNTLKDYWKN
ncbi:MAG: glycoside hydrolase, partial [Clostridiaceae bacterium]|nr:glycoside hydrolase [Clostridiaceae bacterium]